LLVRIAYFITRAPCILPFFPAYAAAYTGHPAGCTSRQGRFSSPRRGSQEEEGIELYPNLLRGLFRLALLLLLLLLIVV
jgi:hypothetical protein